MPFVLAGLAIVHIIALHEDGSNNPMGLYSDVDKISFHHYYVIKDFYGAIIMVIGLLILVFIFPYILGDAENFKKANSLVTPIHIKPEWYFLFAYAILRSIPNKLGGVVALVVSILILLILPLVDIRRYRGMVFRPGSKVLFWFFVGDFLILTWIGGQSVEEPFIIIGQMASMFYFIYFLIIIPAVGYIEDRILGLVR